MQTFYVWGLFQVRVYYIYIYMCLHESFGQLEIGVMSPTNIHNAFPQEENWEATQRRG